MFAATRTTAHEGAESYVVTVEARLTRGLPQWHVVGLPDAAVREGRERVRAALRGADESLPSRRVVVNLSPAARRKAGCGFDLAIAMALLVAAEQLPPSALEGVCFLGELGLDGRVRPVAGALAGALAAARAGSARLVVPRANAREAGLADGIDVYATDTLADAVRLAKNGYRAETVKTDAEALLAGRSADPLDLADVRGLHQARRALEVAAAGAHHMLLTGPPGTGKTMLARRLPGLLPTWSLEQAVASTAIHGIARLEREEPLLLERPFRAPHHTVTAAGLVGGGPILRPGEISLAHNGVLFLDELPEFAPHVLNQLREPIEQGRLTLARAAAVLTFPADFLLVAARNPCPCGYHGSRVRECSCPEQAIRRYRARVSGPLLDRIDIHIDVPQQRYAELTAGAGESTAIVRERVAAASLRRRNRARNDCGPLAVEAEAEELLRRATDRLRLSARAVARVRSVAETIADLEADDRVAPAYLAEALQYRRADAGSET